MNAERLTLDGKLNSFRKPKSSPVASSLPSLVSEVALTMLSVGHIPSQVGPKTEVQLAQSSFSNWKHINKYVGEKSRDVKTGGGRLTDLWHTDVLLPSSRSFEEKLLFSPSVHLQQFPCQQTHGGHHHDLRPVSFSFTLLA